MGTLNKFVPNTCCPLCGAKMHANGDNCDANLFSIDHYYPRALGGDKKEYQAMCRRCNALKGPNVPTVFLYRVVEICRAMEEADPDWHVKYIAPGYSFAGEAYHTYIVVFTWFSLRIDQESQEGLFIFDNKKLADIWKDFIVRWKDVWTECLRYVFGGVFSLTTSSVVSGCEKCVHPTVSAGYVP